MTFSLHHLLRASCVALPALLQVSCWEDTECGDPPQNEEKIFDDDAVLSIPASDAELRGATLRGTFLTGATEASQQRVVEQLSIAVVPGESSARFLCNQKSGARYLLGCMSTPSRDGINVQVHAHQGKMSRFELALIHGGTEEILYRGLLNASKTGEQVCGTFGDAEVQR